MSNYKLVIPPPRPDRPPLPRNAFNVAQGSNTQLKPLFPYLHPGAMVPCSALLIGGPNADYGHFFHHNTQHEIVLTLAANGAMLPTGQLYVGAVIHGVNSFLKNEKDPKSFATFVITQMQADPACRRRAAVCAAPSATNKSSSRNLMLLRYPMQPRPIFLCGRSRRCRRFSGNTTTIRRATSAPNAAT